MDFSIKAFSTNNGISQHKTGCIVVGVYDNGKLTAEAKALDDKGALTAAVKSGDISGKPGSTLLLHRVRTHRLPRCVRALLLRPLR